MGEIIPIVNENDKIICYKDVSELDTGDIKRISCIRIENSIGEVLIAKRSYNMKRLPGKWGPAATGCVEKDESYEDAMIREAKEELGIDIKNYKKGTKIRYGLTFIQNFKSIMDININELKLQKEEVDSVKWINKNELYKLCKGNSDEFVPQLRLFIDDYM